MITIEIKTGKTPTVIVKGHSNYAPKGQDIVCAAVSSLFIALVNSQDGEYVDEGDTKIFKMNEYSKALLMARVGFSMISEQYPMYVRML